MLDPNNDIVTYAKMPNWLLRIPVSDLSHAAKICYMRLAQYYNFNKKCFPSTKKLAEEVGLQKRQVIRELRHLETLKLIKIEARPGSSNRYIFLNNKYRKAVLPVDKIGYNLLILWLGVCQMCHGGYDTSVMGGMTHLTPIINKLIKKLNTLPGGVDNFSSFSDNCPAAFKKCMSIYPPTIYRTTTKVSLALWKKVVAKYGEAKVYAGTAGYAQYCKECHKKPHMVSAKKSFYGKEERFLEDWPKVIEESKKYNPVSRFTFSPKAYNTNKPSKPLSKQQKEKNKKAARKLKIKANGGKKNG
jgi:hypothetical protein